MYKMSFYLLLIALAALLLSTDSFHFNTFSLALRPSVSSSRSALHMSDTDNTPQMQDPVTVDPVFAPMTPGGEDSNVIPENETEEEKYKREKLVEIAEKKAQEVFVTQSTGRFECQACGYIYDEAKGYAKKGIAPNTLFASEAMDKFRCPTCGANKKYFIAETETLSGFKENLKYGLGGNSMTGENKNSLIFGGLALSFLALMSGYLME